VSTVALPGVDDELELELVEQRDRLLERLRVQRIHSAELWDWYHGLQAVPAVPARYREAYRFLLEIARTPWARLVVDTISERLHVQGFEAGPAPELEAEAWRLFNASALNADEWLLYSEALITGAGYLSVSPGSNGDPPLLAPESSFEVTHEPYPGNRRVVAAALKVYPADWSGRDWQLELYRPEATYRWQLTQEDSKAEAGVFPIDGGPRRGEDSLPWQPAEPFTVPNRLGTVPIVPFENRATIVGGGVSELEDCLPVLRRIDKLTLDKLLTSEFASFMQRWATGLEVPKDENGQPIEPFKAAVDRLWVSENPDTRFGAFPASDLAPYLAAIDAEIAALAAISRVPSHYLLQQNLANPPSAESLIASESGLVAKVRQRQRHFGEAWEWAMRLAFAYQGVDAAVTVVWADAEMRNPAQVADAAVKLQGIGVPQEALWAYIGATPQQIEAWTFEQAAGELAALAGGGG
jgi:SPP1 Gp6-like portal protein